MTRGWEKSEGIWATFGLPRDRTEWPLVRADSAHSNVLACDAEGRSRPTGGQALLRRAFVVLEMRAAARLAQVTGRDELSPDTRKHAAVMANASWWKDTMIQSHVRSQNADGVAVEANLLPSTGAQSLVKRLSGAFRPMAIVRVATCCVVGTCSMDYRDGARETAYRMVTVEGCPGWMTLAENPGGTLGVHWQTGSNSMNHPALGVSRRLGAAMAGRYSPGDG